MLLSKELRRGFYREFLGDLHLLPADAATDTYFAGGSNYDARWNPTQERPPLGVFGPAGKLGDAGCPALTQTAAQLAANPRAIRPRLCLAEFFRNNGFDNFDEWRSFDEPLEGIGLATTRQLFPRPTPYSRLEIYKAVIADPAATADDKAFALNRAVRCYAPSGNNSCSGTEVERDAAQGLVPAAEARLSAIALGDDAEDLLVGRRVLLLMAIALSASCSDPDRVDPRNYDAFWLWPGVSPPAALGRARIIYLLDGEIRDGRPVRYVSLRPQPPRLPDKQVWLVIRTDTLAWPEDSYAAITRRLDQWRAAGNGLQGLQVDFDARTRHLEEYAEFLKRLRAQLPARYRLSVTGLLDWSANGDPRALAALAGTVDEVVLQTYQGRGTIPGYEAYFRRLNGFPIPFRVGLVERGQWREPPGLARNPRFKGYVVFLLQPRRRD